jgi:hypothetical protein
VITKVCKAPHETFETLIPFNAATYFALSQNSVFPCPHYPLFYYAVLPPPHVNRPPAESIAAACRSPQEIATIFLDKPSTTVKVFKSGGTFPFSLNPGPPT